MTFIGISSGQTQMIKHIISKHYNWLFQPTKLRQRAYDDFRLPLNGYHCLEIRSWFLTVIYRKPSRLKDSSSSRCQITPSHIGGLLHNI